MGKNTLKQKLPLNANTSCVCAVGPCPSASRLQPAGPAAVFSSSQRRPGIDQAVPQQGRLEQIRKTVSAQQRDT